MPRDSPSEINRRAAELRPTLYPELEREDLAVVVRGLMAEAGYSLDGLGPGYALRRGDRFAQTSCAALERLFLFDLWSKGVCYGAGKTVDPRLMADAIGAFVIGRATIDEMSLRFPFIAFGSGARAHEGGHLVDHCWRERLERNDAVGQLLVPLLQACAQRPRLRALFPFTSHDVLFFSRTTGYPYDSMPACARPVYDPSAKADRYVEKFVPNRYEVFVRGDEPTQPASAAPRTLGTGDADWAAETLEREVPGDWGAAVDGTCEEMAGSLSSGSR
jgi:hypothetical protein